ncbi:MAG: carboxypeptidase regulatory-like domain-containing protein [Acidobacteria bacterium]|nr:MAG: carboxypeptidase regulatory-like domain-containing protein [Acidobacteriota bacterium]
MITGYNTDVRYGDVVLHVQTEDKGTANPYIESLIYHRGQVVVAKRASYADLLQNGQGDEAIMTLMDHQHRMMIKAIRSGKFDDKIRAFAPEPRSSDPDTSQLDLSDEGGRTLDQVILEYLTSEAEQEQLVLMLDDASELRPGRTSTLRLRARSSKSGEAIPGATVHARMISTGAEPRVLASGETDADGVFVLRIDIPEVARGTAALIVTAVSGIGQAELKHLL